MLYVGLSPLPVTVTTRIITFLVGDPYKPSFATVTGRGDNPSCMYTYNIFHAHRYTLRNFDYTPVPSPPDTAPLIYSEKEALDILEKKVHRHKSEKSGGLIKMMGKLKVRPQPILHRNVVNVRGNPPEMAGLNLGRGFAHKQLKRVKIW